MANGSINLFIPATFDNGTNGEKEVRHVTLTGSTIPKRKVGSITIEENSLTNRVFNGASGYNYVTEIEIPEGFITINYTALQSFLSLTSITIPSTVTSIGAGAFQGCSSLTSITIPSGVASIGNAAFQNCPSLTSVKFERQNISTNYFTNSQFNAGANIEFELLASQDTIALTSDSRGITNLDGTILYTYPSASGNFNLATITPNLTRINRNTFQYCLSLTSITIPSSVTNIDHFAFQYCSSLTSVTIPSGVTSIGIQVFQYCSALTSVNLLRTTPPTLSNANAFDGNAAGRTFYIPTDTYAAYSTATNLITFASDMEEVI